MSSAVESAPRTQARTWDRLGIIAWSIVAIVTAMRAVAAFSVPITGDEAYYWEWSRHLALGYSDHPPGVAYTIFAFSWLGTNPFAVRIGFIVCGVIATIFAAKTATRLADGNPRAGVVTALAITLTPLTSVAFGSASPDGPYLAAWAASLYCAVRAFAEASSKATCNVPSWRKCASTPVRSRKSSTNAGYARNEAAHSASSAGSTTSSVPRSPRRRFRAASPRRSRRDSAH